MAAPEGNLPLELASLVLCVHTVVRTPALGLLLLPEVSASILIPEPIESPRLWSLHPWGEAGKPWEGLTSCSMLGIVGQNPVSVWPSRVGHQYLPRDPRVGGSRGRNFLPVGHSVGLPKSPGQARHPAPTQTLPFLRIIFSTPVAIIAYFLIWFVPDFHQGQTLWYLLFYCLFETLVTVSVGREGSPWGLRGWCSKPHLSVHRLTGRGPLFHASVSTFPTQLSPCSSARSRVSVILPLPIVSFPSPLIPPTRDPGSPTP